jgi:8-oxo-dGTP pyrophosphatase MutT (NUDIX family)
MPRPVPPQVVRRPEAWRPGEPAPWGGVPEAERQGITIERITAALRAHGQAGPVPDDVGTDRVFVPSVLIDETDAQWARVVNAGVLAAIFEEEGEARLILTRRSSTLRAHRGEVSFPGGRLDAGEDVTAAALREAHEEVGLDPALVTPLGWLHPLMTMVSASLIVPVLATVPGRPHLVASPDEVERIFDVSLRQLADPSIFHEERWRIPGREIPGSPDGTFPVWFFEVEGELIWGATARMIHELLGLVLPAG